METGYDYTLLGRPARQPAWVSRAALAVALVAILLFAAGGYYGYVTDASANQPAAEAAGAVVPVTAPPNRPVAVVDAAAAGYTGPRIPAPASAIAGQQLYPAGLSEVAYWVNPLAQKP